MRTVLRTTATRDELDFPSLVAAALQRTKGPRKAQRSTRGEHFNETDSPQRYDIDVRVNCFCTDASHISHTIADAVEFVESGAVNHGERLYRPDRGRASRFHACESDRHAGRRGGPTVGGRSPARG